MPLHVCSGLVYMVMHPPTDHELESFATDHHDIQPWLATFVRVCDENQWFDAAECDLDMPFDDCEEHCHTHDAEVACAFV